jgi:glycosyltransferase involved in cell wall biosynthesis
MSEPIVSVCLITYNHAKYIAQAIESVLMQQTNFEWELVIADDFSTDGTREIIKEYKTKYPNRIKLILQEENVGANKNWIDLLSYPKSKYIAYFEGDDYWIDKNKLQLQVDFLECNSDFGMVHTGYKRLISKNNTFSRFYTKQPSTSSIFEFLLTNLNCIATLTVCFKTSLFVNYINEVDPLNKTWKLGDLPLWLFISKSNKVKFFKKKTCVYRILHESASNTVNTEKQISFEKSIMDVKLYFLDEKSSYLKEKIESEFIYRKLRIYFFSTKRFLDFLQHSSDFLSANKIFYNSIKAIALLLLFILKNLIFKVISW